MIITEEHISNALKDLEWFINMNYRRKDVDERVISIENITIDQMFRSTDRDSALKYVSEKLSNILKPLDTDYNLYLMVNKILINKKSKLENYKKVWKYIEEKCDVSEFIYGDEVKIEFHEKEYYSSVAKMKIKDIEKALRIVCLNPDRNFVLISKYDRYLSSEEVQKLFHEAFDSISNKVIRVDYYKLALEIPKEDEMFIRWLDFGDEMEIGLVYNPNRICL
ncbi:hypothetical protein AALA13_17995 [Lachnospiraceae bacterium 50-23]|nr:hypothetical protein IMSAGC015_01695 [Lachnospiraceae bacterium]